MTPQEVRKRLRAIYQELDDGFDDLSRDDERAIRATRSSSTYGEIMPAATAHLLETLQPGPRDVLYDLGSGVGKFVLQAAMSLKAKKIVGLELAHARNDIANDALSLAKQHKYLLTRNVELRCADVLQADLTDATIIYTCSTAFPPAFMKRLATKLATLRKGLVFATLQDFDDERYFDLIEVHRLDMSWARRTPVYIYRLERPRKPK